MRTRVVAVVVALALLSGCLGLSVSDPSGAGTTPSPSDASPVGGSSVVVTEVIDGDTVNVRYANGSRETVRLLGVDTPEVHGSNAPGEFEGVPDTEAGVACLADAGERASAYASDRLEGEQVRLVFDETSDRRGYYGRLLAYVYVDGDSFNYALVSEGHARVYESTFTERERYYGAERTARAEGRGLWSCAEDAGNGTAAADADVEVVRVHPDAAGDDRENLDDEYVVFRNEGEETVRLGGWTVVDAAGNEYTFPAGTTLEPGAELTLRTGTGTDDEGTVYWGRGSPVWNNDGDTITLFDARGTVALERRY